MSRSRRIALVVPNLTGGGGVPSVARFLARAIEGSGDFECELISLATSARDPASLRISSPRSWVGRPRVVDQRWEGRRVRHVGARWVELEFQRYRPRAVLSHLLEDCDLVQVVAGSPAYALVARDFSGPVALQVATLAAVEREERFRRENGVVATWRKAMTGITSRLDRAGARVPDRIFVENDWMRRTLSSWVGPEKLLLAPPGVDTSFFRPPGSDHHRGEPEGYILSVGRFGDPRKNVGLLFEAFARLEDRTRANVELVLAGESEPSNADLERMRELGIGESVQWKGEVSDEQLAELYRGAKLFVLSSTEEGLGLVLLEAMASGLPVVSTRTEGACQVIDEGSSGFLVDVGDAAGLASAMGKVLDYAPLRRQMGRQAREMVEARYSKEVAAEAFLSSYRDLLRRRGSTRDRRVLDTGSG